jgi:hypothetical protein
MGHYRAAVAAVRAGGMRPDRVAVVCPCHYVGLERRIFLNAWREVGACSLGARLCGAGREKARNVRRICASPARSKPTEALRPSPRARHEARSYPYPLSPTTSS